VPPERSSEARIEHLVSRFRDGTLPASEWTTHDAHIVVGTCHVHELGPVRALDAMRAGILRLNEHHGTPNTDSRGYHETITRAYLSLIADALVPTPVSTPALRERPLSIDGPSALTIH
jgi:hypothetical protein